MIPVVSTILEAGLKILDKVIPDPQAKAAAQLKLMELQQTGELAELDADLKLALGQLEVNKAEAANPATFISGWRPAVGWVCVAGLASQYVVGPLVEWLSAILLGERITWPIMNNGELMTLLFGMLGLGALRTTEKIKGVSNS